MRAGALRRHGRLGRNPACIIPAWHDFDRRRRRATGRDAASRCPDRTDGELVECHRHESLLNLAFDGKPDWRLLCPYDTAVLDPAVLADARHNHPHVFETGARQASDDYTETATVLAWDGALPEPENTPVALPFTGDDLLLVRAFVTERARHAGFGDERMADLVLAVNELVTNTIRHAGGRGVLRTWLENGTFLVEVVDGGHIEDPLAGRERAPDAECGGRRLWIVNHLCDLVQLRSSPAGSVVRLHMSVLATGPHMDETHDPRLGEPVLAVLELPDATVATGPDHRIVFVNELAAELFGYAREELVGRPVTTLWPERLRKRYTRNMELYFATEHPLRFSTEVWGVRSDGTEFVGDMSWGIVETATGPLLLAIGRDISERRAAEVRLRAVGGARGAGAGGCRPRRAHRRGG